MKTLALEWSTGRRSVALLDQEEVVAQAYLEARTTEREPDAFALLSEMMEQAGWSWDQLDLLVAGRGPGRYSGMRMSIAALQGLALPTGPSLHAISSGEALAWGLHETYPDAEHIAVVGDARRGRVWLGLFERVPEGWVERETWHLDSAERAWSSLPKGTVVLTSEWDRLEPMVKKEHGSSRVHWCRESCYPEAAWVGRLAVRRAAVGIASDPVSPIYLHPAVQLQ